MNETIYPIGWIDPAVAARNKRDELLRIQIDTINAVRWAAMDEAQRTAWTAYRQALLDVPQQAGFPFDVSWPIKPE